MRAWSTKICASQLSPATAVPTCSSIWNIFHINDRSWSLDPALSSAASTTPSGQAIPRTVAPLLTVSLAYSTWNKRPSGEKTVIARSYAPGTANIDNFCTPNANCAEPDEWGLKTFPTQETRAVVNGAGPAPRISSLKVKLGLASSSPTITQRLDVLIGYGQYCSSPLFGKHRRYDL